MPAARKMRKPDIKMVILGDMNVGKTSLLHRYTERSFKDTLSTVGGAFFLKQWGPYNISIWDTAGREQFHGLGSMYCRGAAAIILTYDVTNWQSLLQLEERFLSLTDSANSDCLFAVVGNKADLTDSYAQVVTPEDVGPEESGISAAPSCPTPPHTPTIHKQVHREDAMALYNRIILYKTLDEGTSPLAEKMCFETSAKTGYNVDSLFETLFELVLPSIIQKQARVKSPTVCLEDYEEEGRKKKPDCCT
ncbi:ras-related protein Rab-20-like isoform X2 [Colossoma macropomum]|uniref:ras-related protein Rab-20-like isoform X2 n=1 Tax=Colossoma macropomum TaxID=42526 RepID=UPI0018640A87|nr:ras-related protein Rab-20-like isoform X2 [Colossoma macropomum]